MTTTPAPKDHIEEEVKVKYKDDLEPEVESPSGGIGPPFIFFIGYSTVLAFLGWLAGTETTPSMPPTKVLGLHPTIVITSRRDELRVHMDSFVWY